MSKPKPRSKRTHAHRNQPKIVVPHAAPVSVKVVNDEWHAEEKQHRKEEKEYWRKSRRYSVLAVVIALLAFGAALGAFVEARRQADAALVGNQPWLKITKIEPIGRLDFSRDLINIAFAIHFTNIGHEPAQHIQVAVIGPVNDFDLFLKSQFGTICREGQASWSSLSPNVAFPADPELKITGGIYRQNQSPTDAPKGALVGCLYYQDSATDQHVTAFAYPLNDSQVIYNAYAD